MGSLNRILRTVTGGGAATRRRATGLGSRRAGARTAAPTAGGVGSLLRRFLR
jgi:hypothetical protein